MPKRPPSKSKSTDDVAAQRAKREIIARNRKAFILDAVQQLRECLASYPGVNYLGDRRLIDKAARQVQLAACDLVMSHWKDSPCPLVEILSDDPGRFLDEKFATGVRDELASIEQHHLARRAHDEPAGDARAVDDDSHLSPAKLAELFDVPADALRSRLNRWRNTTDKGWIENPDRTGRDAKYLYRVGSVRNIIGKMQKSTGERPAKK